jgi:hypothetical protein
MIGGIERYVKKLGLQFGQKLTAARPSMALVSG